MRMILGVCLSLLLLAGCTGGYRASSYAISQNEKPVKTKRTERTFM